MSTFTTFLCIGLASFVFGTLVVVPLSARALGCNGFSIVDDEGPLIALTLLAVLPPFMLAACTVVIIFISMKWVAGAVNLYGKMASAVVKQ